MKKRDYQPVYVISMIFFVAAAYATFYHHAIITGFVLFLIGVVLPMGDDYMKGK